MTNVYACERLLPVAVQFAADQIHQQPARDTAAALRPHCRITPTARKPTLAWLPIAWPLAAAGSIVIRW
jgi:hypothetical protein